MITRVGRAGKMLIVEAGDLALLIDLMSAGRLQLWDKRASLRDRASRLLVRVADGRELRLRESGPSSERGRSCCRPPRWRRTRRSRRSARRLARSAARGLRRADRAAPPSAFAASRPARIAGSGGHGWTRSSGRSSCRLSRGPRTWTARRWRAFGRVRGGTRARARPLRGGGRRHDPRQDADAAQGPPPHRRAVPALRHDARGRPLPRLRDHVLPGGANGGRVLKDRRLSRLLK